MWRLRVVREVTDCEGRSVQGPAGQLRLQAGVVGFWLLPPEWRPRVFSGRHLMGGRGQPSDAALSCRKLCWCLLRPSETEVEA